MPTAPVTMPTAPGILPTAPDTTPEVPPGAGNEVPSETGIGPVSTEGPGAEEAPAGGGVAPASAAPVEQRSAAAQSAGQLAYTGFELPILILGGLSALAAGALLRRRARIGA
jgi:hypothetical protein